MQDSLTSLPEGGAGGEQELRALGEILTKLENAVQHDISLRMTQHRSGRSPKSIHAEALTALTQLIQERERRAVYGMHEDIMQDNLKIGTEPDQALI